MKKVFYNGVVRTMDKSNPSCDYFIVDEDRIIQTGKELRIEEYDKKDFELVNLKGKTVIPGFNDSHMHLAMIGSNLYECDLVGVESVDELVDRVKKYIIEKGVKPGDWVTGKGWNEDYFVEKKLPNRHDLDRISEEHYICLTRGCYHMCVVNSRALNHIGINEKNHLIQGGVFDIDDGGVPTGICRERAMKLVYEQLPEIGKEKVKTYIELAANHLVTKGVTSVQTDDFMVPGVKWEDVISAYKELEKEGKLKLRVYEQCLFTDLEKFKVFVEMGYKTGQGDDYFKIGPLKIIADGNFGTRTASLSEPYFDDSSTKGIAQYTQKELDELIEYATKKGFQIAVHAIGDNSSKMVVESLKKLPKELKDKDLRPNLVHFQVTNQYLLESCLELGIIANLQPIFLNYDIHMAESRLGPVRIKDSYNFRTIIERGISVAFGSDSPIEPPDPVFGIYSAVNRKDMSGYPKEGWYPEEKISIEQAVRGFTLGSAYASYDEEKKGSIEVGKLADFIVLSEDLFKIKPEEIKNVKILETYVGGSRVYSV